MLLASSFGYNIALAQRVSVLRTMIGDNKVRIDDCILKVKTADAIGSSRLNILEQEVFGTKPPPTTVTQPVQWPKNRLDQIDKRLNALEQFRLKTEKEK